ncbi:hypothetical protein MKW92_025451 [Papaver armeniacum]|nr:hypothetical protein MKW92_025451 [Papaver armeniacum]
MARWDEWIRKYENDCAGDTSAGSNNYTKQPISSTSRIEKLKEGVRDIVIGDASTKQPISPPSQIQKQPTDEWVDEWIKRYDNLSRLGTCAGSTRKSVCPTSQIQKQSINLKVSLQMFLQEATSFADQWTDVNRKYDDRRSFPTFLRELQIDSISSVLIWMNLRGVPLHLWNATGFSRISSLVGKPIMTDAPTAMKTRMSFARVCVEIDANCSFPSKLPFQIDDMKYEVRAEYPWKPSACSHCKSFGHTSGKCISNPAPKYTKRWSLQAPSDNVVPLRSKLTSDPNWVMANKYYGRSLSLMQLLHRIHSKSVVDFSREQAELLGSFLGHLIMLQQEQRVVAYSFSEHLEQLRKCNEAASPAFFSNAVDDDGDRIKCPLFLSEHTMDSYMGRQKHQFDRLYIILRESTWLLKKLEDSRFTIPSFVEESHKILEKIVGFTSEFKKSKFLFLELLDQYLSNKSLGYLFIEEKVMQLVQENKETLYHFVKHIKGLQEEGVGKGSVIEKLLDCLVDVSEISMEKDSSSSIPDAFMKAVEETAELIQEARKKLNSDRFATLNGGSPLGNITLWRILFESSLVDLRLDLINKKHGKAIKLGVKVGEHKCDYHVQTCLNGLHAKFSLLLSDGDRVLREFVAMHKTIAEITYMLGDAFTTGGAGMKELEASEESSSKDEKAEMEMNLDLDFPWDKHNVPDEVDIDWEDPNSLVTYICCDYYGPEGDVDFDLIT